MKHNKKRNVGLLYEFLTRYAAEGIVEGNEKKTRAVMKLLKKHFKEGSELQKEFRLFRALAGSYVADQATAERIVETSRNAARKYDQAKLDREKSLLIRSINHVFNDASFYDKRIEEYKLFATIQTLLNEWRESIPSDIVQVAIFESDLVEHLLKPKDNNILDERSSVSADDLTVNLMLNRVNGKYKGMLNTEQIVLLNSYVNSLKSGNDQVVHEAIDKLKSETLDAIDSYMKGKTDADLIEKLTNFKKLVAENVDVIDDRALSHYLRIAGLKREILGS